MRKAERQRSARRRPWARLTLLVKAGIWPSAVFLGLGLLAAERTRQNKDWRQVSPGLEYRRVETAASSDGGTAIVHVVRADLTRWRLRLLRSVPGETVTARAFAARHGAVAVINGGFFDEQLRPLGLRVASGKEWQPLRRNGWSVFLVRDGKPDIVTMSEYSHHHVAEAIQCGPRLVARGRVTRLKKQLARRACVGVDGAGRVLLVVTEGSPMEAAYLARLLASPATGRGLGCRDALNLDGGGSAQLYLKYNGLHLDIPGAWGVPDALGIFPK